MSNDKPLVQLDVSVIIRNDKNQVLLMLRPENDHSFPLCWGVPGGGFEMDDTSLEDTARREVSEEVGVRIKNLRMVTSDFLRKYSSMFVIFMADYDSGEIVIDEREVKQAGWFSLDQVNDGRKFTPKTKEPINNVLTN